MKPNEVLSGDVGVATIGSAAITNSQVETQSPLSSDTSNDETEQGIETQSIPETLSSNDGDKNVESLASPSTALASDSTTDTDARLAVDSDETGDGDAVENKSTSSKGESSAVLYVLLAAIVAGVLIVLGVVSYRQNNLLSEMEEEEEYDTRDAKMNNCMSIKIGRLFRICNFSNRIRICNFS